MTIAVVALGSNVPPRRDTLFHALRDVARVPATRLMSSSAWRETSPVGCPPGTSPFLNGACLLETSLTALALLEQLLDIEVRHGRVRSIPNASRTLDLDLILHGDTVVATSELTVPHPRAHERLFVLEPAADLAPQLRHPVLDRTLAELRDACRGAAADLRARETPA